MRWTITDDIYNETWRQLLEFANLDLTLDVINRRYGSPRSAAEKTNHSKQAKQARVCVLQAKEYFDAARASSLFTSPNHVYYGAVALASLVLLILGDGRMSLDVLRQDNRNNHHGLDFTTGCTAKTAATNTALLEQSFVQVLQHGHFANWYRALPSTSSVYATIHTVGDGLSSVGYRKVGVATACRIEQLTKKKFRLIDRLKSLPDLDAELHRFGIDSPRCKSTHEIFISKGGEELHQWRLYAARSAHELEQVMSKFATAAAHSGLLSFNGDTSSLMGIVSINIPAGRPISFTWPDCRDTMNHDTISYADDIVFHEVVDLHLIAYQLSMLSRYFPDIWIGCMESQCRAAKLIERGVEIISKKLPILVLGLLHGDETIISTHREPWKS